MHHPNEISIPLIGQLLEIANVVLQPHLVLAGLRNREPSLPARHDVAENEDAAQFEFWRRTDDRRPGRGYCGAD